jgi:cobalamin synthase
VFAGSAAALWVAFRFRRLLAGLTGDVYGAAIELAEAACLLGLSLR